MNIKEYRTKYFELEQNISNAQREFEIFKISNYEFKNLYEYEQEKHLRWFVEHFDYIQRHKEYIKNSPILSKIVIDFLPLFDYAGLASGAAFQYGKKFKIFLGNLLNIWDEGFCYQNFPIISYKARIHYNTDITIQYIQEKQIKTLQRKVIGSFKHLPELDPEIFKKITNANVVTQFPDMMTYPNLSLIIDVCK